MVYKVIPVKEKGFVHIPGRWNGECKNELSYTTTQLFFSLLFITVLFSVYIVCGVGVGELCVTLRGRLGFLLQAASAASISLVLPAEIT